MRILLFNLNPHITLLATGALLLSTAVVFTYNKIILFPFLICTTEGVTANTDTSFYCAVHFNVLCVDDNIMVRYIVRVWACWN